MEGQKKALRVAKSVGGEERQMCTWRNLSYNICPAESRFEHFFLYFLIPRIRLLSNMDELLELDKQTRFWGWFAGWW